MINHCLYSKRAMHTNETIKPDILMFIYFCIKKIKLIKCITILSEDICIFKNE